MRIFLTDRIKIAPSSENRDDSGDGREDGEAREVESHIQESESEGSGSDPAGSDSRSDSEDKDKSQVVQERLLRNDRAQLYKQAPSHIREIRVVFTTRKAEC